MIQIPMHRIEVVDQYAAITYWHVEQCRASLERALILSAPTDQNRRCWARFGVDLETARCREKDLLHLEMVG